MIEAIKLILFIIFDIVVIVFLFKLLIKTNQSSKKNKHEYVPSDEFTQKTDDVVPDQKYDFKIVGVTFNNENGTSRQKLLKALYNREFPFESSVQLELIEYSYEGNPAIKVLADGHQLGVAPADCVYEILEIMKEHPDMNIGGKMYIVPEEDIYGMYIKLRW